MEKRLKFYSYGLILGMILVFIMFGNRDFSCNVMPNSRVLTEIRSKKFFLTDETKKQLKEFNLDEHFIYKKVFYDGNINFKESDAQKKPCPIYKIYYTEQKKEYYIKFEKCKEIVTVNGIFLVK